MVPLEAKAKRGLVKNKRGSVKTEPQIQLTVGAKNIPIKPWPSGETNITLVATSNTQ